MDVYVYIIERPRRRQVKGDSIHTGAERERERVNGLSFHFSSVTEVSMTAASKKKKEDLPRNTRPCLRCISLHAKPSWKRKRRIHGNTQQRHQTRKGSVAPLPLSVSKASICSAGFSTCPLSACTCHTFMWCVTLPCRHRTKTKQQKRRCPTKVGREEEAARLPPGHSELF